MNKKIKGMTLITLVVSILVMLLILTTIVVSASGIIDNTRKKQFAKELYLVQSSWDTYVARNSGKTVFTENDSVVITLSDLAQGGSSQFESETSVDGKITLKAIDLYKIDVENVNFGNKKDGVTDRYLVSVGENGTGRIYYQKGFTINGKTYYTLTDDLKK